MARLCIDPSDSLELGKQREIQNKTKKSRHLFMLLQSSLGAKKITRERDFKITCLSKCSDCSPVHLSPNLRCSVRRRRRRLLHARQPYEITSKQFILYSEICLYFAWQNEYDNNPKNNAYIPLLVINLGTK